VISGRDAHDATSADTPVPIFPAALDGRDLQPAHRSALAIPGAGRRRGRDRVVHKGAGRRRDRGRRDRRGQPASRPSRHRHLLHRGHGRGSSNLARYDGVRFGLRAGDGDLRSMYGDTRDADSAPKSNAASSSAPLCSPRATMTHTICAPSACVPSYARDFERAFEDCDAIAMPTTPSCAFRIGEKASDPLQM